MKTAWIIEQLENGSWAYKFEHRAEGAAVKTLARFQKNNPADTFRMVSGQSKIKRRTRFATNRANN